MNPDFERKIDQIPHSPLFYLFLTGIGMLPLPFTIMLWHSDV